MAFSVFLARVTAMGIGRFVFTPRDSRVELRLRAGLLMAAARVRRRDAAAE
ncbi:hypothetical protein AAFN90_00200 [Erwiniaceae bacterium CAU 1747]